MSETRYEMASNDALKAMVSQSAPLDGMPVVKRWNPSLASGAIGVVCYFALWSLVAFAEGSLCALAFGRGELAADMGRLLAGVVQLAVMLVYAAVFYPSYFADDPVLKRCDGISFANYFAGGIIFGYLWNKNIRFSKYVKRPEKGASYVVAIALASVGLGGSVLSLASVALSAAMS